MKKIFILDTNVLLHDPRAIFAFEENEVIIPAVVLEEIDGKKRNSDEIGRNARYVARMLDNLRANGGRLDDGVALEQGGSLKVELNHKSFVKMQEMFGEVTNDNRILAVALNYFAEQQKKTKPQPVILVSKDTLVRIKADVLGIAAQDYLNDRLPSLSELYTGCDRVIVSATVIDDLYMRHRLPLTQLQQANSFYPHQFLILQDDEGSSKSALVKVCPLGKTASLLHLNNDPIWGISARNAQQRMALELLLNDEIPLVTITGRAGTGKTLLALAAGLLKTEDEHQYNKLLIGRPVVPIGKDIGYLPGEKEDKLRPWMQPIYDNLEYLFNTKKSEDIHKILAGLSSIQVEALTYIRGRSIPGQFIIIDEAQNLSRHEVKTIVSRVGERSKIVLMGDPEQIDHPYLDATSNGLSYLVERFKDESISGHITLEKGERSQLAQRATELL